MTSNTPTLADFARRMRSLVEEDVRIAADLRELAKEMRDMGLSAANLKGLVKALVLAEDGNEKPLENLKAKIQDVAIYAEALGIHIEGFGETKRFVSDETASQAKPDEDAGGESRTPAPDDAGSRASGGAGTAAPITEPGEHRQGYGLESAPAGDVREDGSSSEAPHTCGAGAGDRPMRAARPTITEPVATEQGSDGAGGGKALDDGAPDGGPGEALPAPFPDPLDGAATTVESAPPAASPPHGEPPAVGGAPYDDLAIPPFLRERALKVAAERGRA